MTTNTKLATIVCLPFAGAGSSIFNSWTKLSNKFNILPVKLPGREKRFAETAYQNIKEAITGIVPELLDELDFSYPIIFFGHSMGAILAFELACALFNKEQIKIKGLVVSGSPSPWNNRNENASGLPDEEFVQRVSEFAGYSHPALEDPVMRELLLPTLRADVKLHESYQPITKFILPVDILTIRGIDDELVSRDDKKLWRKATSAKVFHRELPGGHMHLVDNQQNIITLIENTFFQNEIND
jgi:surfactin synthase thioesterase subunit